MASYKLAGVTNAIIGPTFHVTMSVQLKASIAYQISRHVDACLYDESAMEACGISIYTLSDPRDVRYIRYIGQTANPRQRFLQHLRTARLWLPQTVPWWVASPRLRPLYDWIRVLYRDECRLPVMVIKTWEETRPAARAAERELIFRSLENALPILNMEAETYGAAFELRN